MSTRLHYYARVPAYATLLGKQPEAVTPTEAALQGCHSTHSIKPTLAANYVAVGACLLLQSAMPQTGAPAGSPCRVATPPIASNPL